MRSAPIGASGLGQSGDHELLALPLRRANCQSLMGCCRQRRGLNLPAALQALQVSSVDIANLAHVAAAVRACLQCHAGATRALRKPFDADFALHHQCSLLTVIAKSVRSDGRRYRVWNYRIWVEGQEVKLRLN